MRGLFWRRLVASGLHTPMHPVEGEREGRKIFVVSPEVEVTCLPNTDRAVVSHEPCIVGIQ